MSRPTIWDQAISERHTRLGLLCAQERKLAMDLEETQRAIALLHLEIAALDRTSGLAAQVQPPTDKEKTP